MAVKLNSEYLKPFIADYELDRIKPLVTAAHDLLESRSGAGSDFLGWVDLPVNYDKEEFARINAAAERIKKSCDVFIVIGIGGSYLGARAVIEALRSSMYNNLKKDTPDIYYVGNSINPAYLNDILSICEGKDICVNVISKSGTTTEPALAFRIFKKLVEDKYGKEEAKNRIFATTDKAKGTLKSLSDTEGYETFVVPDDVGGRLSVLTAVGLLPIAVAGIDIDKLMAGAANARAAYAKNDDNDCYKYAALRNILYNKGKSVEMLISYDPSFAMMNEWFKQLYGESEGKDQKGIFPASAVFSTDLHSLGQFIQDGSRIMFETVLNIKSQRSDLFLQPDAENLDGLNFLTNQNMSVVNEKAYQGTILAHTEGGVPNLVLELDAVDEETIGWLIYFFEKACAISGYMLGVNPFDQPGVESYKKNMFALLGKPGYESMKAELEAKLK
ncbi:glucose-6-phosphate isomerase [Ruminococcus sp. YE71]|uniref:glucose-6-phosphate isomerase n=1 Tax=unclassified Ruminococcus TaxID=2608920 RepID=UPI000882C80F|nr:MULTISPECIES: glucose-6-phosphate isomerase [unclassified Ruminococcus]SDA20869.1 glucose-6-phosphate isomerase [Ruminococcus sp. YE78]SFW33468.1 glucose-6-phosphate isomerase [Ruminococcus sp. YE71]